MFDLSYNFLNGLILLFFLSLGYLEYFIFDYNFINLDVLYFLGFFKEVKILSFLSCGLIVKIFISVFFLRNFFVLYLDKNNFSGNVFEILGLFFNLGEFNLS